MKEKADRARRLGKLKFREGQHVRISKEKVKFAKGGEQNYATEIFKLRKVVHRTPRPVFELEDLRGREIEGQFYTENWFPFATGNRPLRRYTKYCTRGPDAAF